MAWASADYRYTLDMIFRHRPIPLVDGLIKLTHVGIGETAVRDLRSSDEMIQRTSSLGDLLYQLEMAYDSQQGLELGERIMAFIQEEGHKASA